MIEENNKESEVKKDVVQINANLCGIDGNYEASGSTICLAFAKALDENNQKLAPLALAGAIGDKQHIGGIRGYNKKILDDALKNNQLKQYISIKLHGDSIYDALYHSVDPYYVGLSGDKKEIESLLSKLKIDKNTRVNEIDKDKKMRLQSYLLFNLIKAGCQKNILDIAIRNRFWSEQLGCELERFADLLDACGKHNHRSLGLAICLGNKDSYKEAEEVEKKFKQKILNGLKTLENNTAHEMKAIRYFYSDDSSLGGVIGGIAANYIYDEKKPLFSLARKEDEKEIHVSCRGNQQLVRKGLDLGFAMKKVATDLNGHGGGHKIASGATIDIQKEKEFLDKTDEIINTQIKW